MNELATIGHNSGILSPEGLQSTLRDENGSLLLRRDDLLAAIERAPEVIDDDETAGKVADFIKQLTAAHKAAEASRVAAKEPYLSASRVVDGFFKAITDPLEKGKKKIEGVLTVYQRKRANEERLRREEEERRATEERQRAEREQREAEATRRRQEEEAARVLAAAKNESDMAAAIKADEERKKRQAEEDQKRREADEARAEEERKRREATAKAADMTSNRGDFGAMASLRTVWDFADLDRNDLDIEALRHHIPNEGLEKAVRAWIKANAGTSISLKDGKQPIRGVRIFQSTTTVVR